MAQSERETLKVLSSTGVPFLCSYISSIASTAGVNSSAVTRLAEIFSIFANEVESALNDYPSATTFTALSTGWVKDNEDSSGYPYYYEVSVASLTNGDVVIVNPTRESLIHAVNSGLCQLNQSFNGRFRIYSRTVPETDLAFSYFVIPGKTNKSSESITLSTDSVSLTNSNPEESITVNHLGSGKVTVGIDDTSVAEVSYQHKVLSVKGLASGTAVVTLTVAGDLSHNGAFVEIPVTVDFSSNE